MSTGIFGPRSPSYPLPSTSSRSFIPSYALPSYTSYPNPYASKTAYPYPPQATYLQPSYSTTMYGQLAYTPYQYFPASPVYPKDLPYFTPSYSPRISPYLGDNSAQGLDAILIAILVLVSLDLIFVRPLKMTSR